MTNRKIRREFLAELVGTFILVFLGTGAVVSSNIVATGLAFGFLQYLAIGIAFGGALAVAAYTVGPISGAHLNPAVTIALAMEKRLPKGLVIPYIAAQCVGAVLASWALLTLLGTKLYGLAETTVGPLGLKEALGAEAALTALLVFTILGVTEKGGSTFGGLLIGLYLAISHLVGIPFSGNSLNPARSLGPALFMGGEALQQLVPVYVVAPIIGGLVGVVIYRGTRG